MAIITGNSCRSTILAFFAAFALANAPAVAKVTEIDPDAAIDGDLAGQSVPAAPRKATETTVETAPGPWIDISPEPVAGNGTPSEEGVSSWDADDISGAAGTQTVAANGAQPAAAGTTSATYHKDDLIGAAEGVFGKGSYGLASMIEDLLKKQGEPNGYIVGREGGGAFVLGLRYGSGTLHHKVEGERPVYWTGPSFGLDLGANAANAFVLVYNLYDTQDLYKRFGAGEGQAYMVGGFNVSYLKQGDVVLIPVRMGAGLRLGANVGYMKFSEKQKWMPF